MEKLSAGDRSSQGGLLGAAASPAARTRCTPVMDSLGAAPVAERAGGEDSVVVI